MEVQIKPDEKTKIEIAKELEVVSCFEMAIKEKIIKKLNGKNVVKLSC